jgi:hypothetical protein
MDLIRGEIHLHVGEFQRQQVGVYGSSTREGAFHCPARFQAQLHEGEPAMAASICRFKYTRLNLELARGIRLAPVFVKRKGRVGCGFLPCEYAVKMNGFPENGVYDKKRARTLLCLGLESVECLITYVVAKQ